MPHKVGRKKYEIYALLRVRNGCCGGDPEYKKKPRRRDVYVSCGALLDLLYSYQYVTGQGYFSIFLMM